MTPSSIPFGTAGGDDEYRCFSLPTGLPSGRRLPPAGAVMPHMHLLGKQIHVDRIEASGALSPLVHIDDWSFDWQDTYFFEQPATVSQGEGLRVECVYDNSAANPNNPNRPPKPVSYGERTVDEMCLAILFLTVDFPAGP